MPAFGCGGAGGAGLLLTETGGGEGGAGLFLPWVGGGGGGAGLFDFGIADRFTLRVPRDLLIMIVALFILIIVLHKNMLFSI